MSQLLTSDERERYHRHLILPNVGEDGQQKLRAARVLLIGAGGLGSPAALYLAAAGVGVLGIIDHDLVEISNLQRQVLHGTPDVGRPKVESARTRLQELNPHAQVNPLHARLSRANVRTVIRDYDIIVDGSDNFETRYRVNDACVEAGKHNVYGAVVRFDGQASVFSPGDGPCYRCMFPEPPEPGTTLNCAEGGVLGVLPGLVGVIQATEAIKLITGIGESLRGTLLLIDALRMQFHRVEIPRNPDCRACGTREFPALTEDTQVCAVPDTSDSDEDLTADEITPEQLHARLDSGAAIAVLDVREPYEWAIARIQQARLIPLNSLPNAVHSLDSNAETVVYCHHGSRSAAAVEWLHDHGFAHVRNLVGGIDRWSLEVDQTVPRY